MKLSRATLWLLWLTAGLSVSAPLLYFLASGPAYWMTYNGYLLPHQFDAAFGPLGNTMHAVGVQRVLELWISLWSGILPPDWP